MSHKPELIAIECPYSEDIPELRLYMQRAIQHVLDEGNIPFPRHMFSIMLHPDRRLPSPDDPDCPYIRAGLAIGKLCDATYMYRDYGWAPETNLGDKNAVLNAKAVMKVGVGRITQEEIDAFSNRRNHVTQARTGGH